MKRLLMPGLFALILGLPLGWILTLMATPLLWRLEPILHLELAGHSGPADWVFFVGWGILVPALFFLFRRKIGQRRKPGI